MSLDYFNYRNFNKHGDFFTSKAKKKPRSKSITIDKIQNKIDKTNECVIDFYRFFDTIDINHFKSTDFYRFINLGTDFYRLTTPGIWCDRLDVEYDRNLRSYEGLALRQ